MPVTIKFDKDRCVTRITNTFNSNLGMLSAEILADCNEYCKEDTGMLIASSIIHSQLDKGLLVWATPYARRQYYEIRTASTDVNPMATWRWCEVAKSRRLERWQRQAQALMRRSL